MLRQIFKSFVSSSQKPLIKKNELFLGLNEETKKADTINLDESNNFIYAGGLGSGKTLSLQYSLVNWLKFNMDQSMVFLINSRREMNEYAFLWQKLSNNKRLEQIHRVSPNVSAVSSLIELLSQELELRVERFEKTKNSPETKDPEFTKIMTIIEDFDLLCKDLALDQWSPGSVPAKLARLLRVGRAYGIHFLVATTDLEQVPIKILVLFGHILTFKGLNNEIVKSRLEHQSYHQINNPNQYIDNFGRIRTFPDFNWEVATEELLNNYQDLKKNFAFDGFIRCLALDQYLY